MMHDRIIVTVIIFHALFSLFICIFSQHSTSMRVTFYHDHDLDFAPFGPLQMPVVPAEVTQEVAGVLVESACM